MISNNACFAPNRLIFLWKLWNFSNEATAISTQIKLRCSGGILFCPKIPNFTTKSRDDSYCHIAKQHATPRVKIAHKCKICFQESSGFYALQQNETNKHGI